MSKINTRKIKYPSKNFARNLYQRYIPLAASLGLVISILIPSLSSNFVSAYSQVQYRTLQMSTSAANASSVSYSVGFQNATTGPIESVAVDFCSNDPIIGDTCTQPTAFTAGSAISGSGFGGLSGGSGAWTASTANTSRTFLMSDASATGNITSGTSITFVITGNHNPSTVGTFYARVFTFANSGDAATWAAASGGNGSSTTLVIDAGGIALSTVNQLTITSKVQETITFCVYTSSFDSGNCSGTGSTVQLGNSNGVLSSTGPYVDIATKYDIQTNAQHGAIIDFEGTPLTSPAPNTIEASSVSGTGSTAGTAYADNCPSSVCTPQFGFCTWAAGGTETNLTIAATYASNSGSTYNGTSSPCASNTSQTSGTGATGGAGSATFGFNITQAATTYGDQIASDIAGPYSQGEIAFLGNISTSTVAGIYTTTLTFIATGTY